MQIVHYISSDFFCVTRKSADTACLKVLSILQRFVGQKLCNGPKFLLRSVATCNAYSVLKKLILMLETNRKDCIKNQEHSRRGVRKRRRRRTSSGHTKAKPKTKYKKTKATLQKFMINCSHHLSQNLSLIAPISSERYLRVMHNGLTTIPSHPISKAMLPACFIAPHNDGEQCSGSARRVLTDPCISHAAHTSQVEY